MLQNLTIREISGAFRAALQQGLVRPDDTSMIFYDLDFLEERIKTLHAVFPSGTLHAVAIKACPLARILELCRELGCGAEAASLGEVILALRTGFDPAAIIYDSPVKTTSELEFALHSGVHVNIDNLTELHRVQKILSAQPAHGNIGLRINPQVGPGTIAESSVADAYSKFGVPLRYRRQELRQAFMENDWLTGVHLHVGSQGCSPELLSKGAAAVFDFLLEVNQMTLETKGYRQIRIFDIGGGLPVSYSANTPPPSMAGYVSQLKERFSRLSPDLSDDPFSCGTGIRMITEFGRWTFVNAGYTITRVEYVKHDPDVSTAMIHVGADLFVRECLSPAGWHHEYTLLDPDGNPKAGVSSKPWNLAGPLCFSGDILAKGLDLPEAEEGDYLVIHDTGGYTFSMWSHYNSRFTSRILGYRGKEFRILKERETEEQMRGFWE